MSIICVSTMREFALRLKGLMDRAQLNQVELSRRSGIPQPVISSYLNESDKGRLPSFNNLIALHTALKCTIEELTGLPIPDKVDLSEMPSEEAMKIGRAFERLSPEDQQFLIEIIKRFKQKEDPPPSDTDVKPD